MFKQTVFQQTLLISILILILGFSIYNFPILAVPFAIVLTLISFFLYKKNILLPEKHEYSFWLSILTIIVLALFLVNLSTKYEQKIVFAKYFVDGKIEYGATLNDGPSGAKYWNDYEKFVPSSPKGARVLLLFEYIFFGLSTIALISCYKILDKESKKLKTPFWYITELKLHFESEFARNDLDVTTNEFIELYRYYKNLDADKYWNLKQKINLQLGILKTQCQSKDSDFPDFWMKNNYYCLKLSEIIILNLIYLYDPKLSYTEKDREHFPYEKSLILKAISYYIHETKSSSFSGNRESNIKTACLFELFYNIQSDYKNYYGKKSGKSTKEILLEGVFKDKIEILIVDDHALFRKSLNLLLSKDSSFSIVGEAENGQELKDKLKHKKCDIVTLGIQMPIMDGLQFLRQFNYKEYPKILNLSFLNDTKVINLALKNGASTYLGKSRENEKLIKGIKSVFAFGFYYSDDIKRLVNDNSVVD